jgi:hypothetical protein
VKLKDFICHLPGAALLQFRILSPEPFKQLFLIVLVS